MILDVLDVAMSFYTLTVLLVFGEAYRLCDDRQRRLLLPTEVVIREVSCRCRESGKC